MNLFAVIIFYRENKNSHRTKANLHDGYYKFLQNNLLS